MDKSKEIISSLRKLRVMILEGSAYPNSVLNKMLEEQKNKLLTEYQQLDFESKEQDIWKVLCQEEIDSDDEKQENVNDDEHDEHEQLPSLENVTNFKSQIDEDLAREEFEQVLGKMEDVSLLDKKNQSRKMILKKESKPPITITMEDGTTVTIPYVEDMDGKDVSGGEEEENDNDDLGARNDPDENLDFVDRYRNMKSVKLLVEKMNELVYAKKQWTLNTIVYWLSSSNNMYRESVYDSELKKTVFPSNRRDEDDHYLIDLIYDQIDQNSESIQKNPDSDSESESDGESQLKPDKMIDREPKKITPLIRIEESSTVYSLGYDILDVICHKSNDWRSANRFLKENYYEENLYVDMSNPIYATRSKRELLREHLCIDVLQHWRDFDRWLVYGSTPMDEAKYAELLDQVPIKRYRMVLNVKERTIRLDFTFGYLNEQTEFDDPQEAEKIQKGEMVLEAKPLLKVLKQESKISSLMEKEETVLCSLERTPWLPFKVIDIIYVKNQDKFIFENRENKERSLTMTTGFVKISKMAKLLDIMMDQWILQEKKAEALNTKFNNNEKQVDGESEEDDLELELKHKVKKQKL